VPGRTQEPNHKNGLQCENRRSSVGIPVDLVISKIIVRVVLALPCLSFGVAGYDGMVTFWCNLILKVH